MNILVTGGAGFIGRWVVKLLLEHGHRVVVLDNLSNSSVENIKEFMANDSKSIQTGKMKYTEGVNFKFIEGDIRDEEILTEVFKEKFDIIYHLAASINVQDSIDDPRTTFMNDVVGTFNILEKARIQMFGKNAKMQGDKWNLDENEEVYPCKVVFMSTCMVYDKANDEQGISELHLTKPVSPYGGSKIAAENMVLSYNYAYKLPTVVIRPFNTYGPFQKTGGEGGVVAIFIKNLLLGNPINIYGSGKQTRDLLYVKDCAKFVVSAGYSNEVNGEIVNAGTGKDISINELAKVISKERVEINHIQHIHPQSEIMKLKCDYSKAKVMIGWKQQYTLEEGLGETEQWIKAHENMK